MNVSFGGASAAAQAFAFAVSFGFGLAGGIAALLYLRKARPIERALTDLTATLVLGSLYFLSLEIGSDGQPALFNFAAFAIGVAVIPCAFSRIRRRSALKRESDSADAERKKRKFRTMRNKRR